MRTVVSLYIYIYTSLYSSNKYLVFKRVSTINISGTMFGYNRNLKIITTL